MKRGATVEDEIVDAGRRDPGSHSRFGKEMRRLSERAVASAKKRLSLAEINREVARRRGSPHLDQWRFVLSSTPAF